jgi:hypothetical protein
MLFNSGPQVRESTCNQPLVENIFMAGTEKTPINFTVQDSGIKSGYKIRSSDSLIAITDLQNFADKEKYVWHTVTYDLVDGNATDHLSSHTVWLTIGTLENPSIGLCHYLTGEFPWGNSNLTSKDLPKVKRFSEHSKIWRADKPAQVLAAGGHMHAGATNLQIFKNSEVFCDSIATYGTANSGHAHGGMGMKKRQVKAGNYTNSDVSFIENISMCEFPKGVPLAVNDAMHIQTNYDMELHKG